MARHRLAARLVCVALGLAQVALLVASIVAGDVSWVTAAVLFSWVFTTLQIGWIFPQQVDQWEARSSGDG